MPSGVYIRTEKHKKIISKILKLRWQNPEYRKKMSEVHRGKISPMKGKTHSEEAKKKMSKSLKGRIAWNKGKKCQRNLKK